MTVINPLIRDVDFLSQLIYRAYMVARGLGSGYQGMNWIRQEKRLAIYMRDGIACVYCGMDAETARMTLDHVKPFSEGGSNEADNLVTACLTCNSQRGATELNEFAGADVVEYIREQLERPIDVKESKRIITKRRNK